jgi:nitrite reductase/ring-hydroxylating ferredoxin subunit
MRLDCLECAKLTISRAAGKFVKIGTAAEFEDVEAGKLLDAGGRSLAVFRVGTTYYAIDNTCTHRGPLAEGMLVGEEVICPWHGAHFNVKTGAVCSPPAREGVKSYLVRVSGDDVEVEII